MSDQPTRVIEEKGFFVELDLSTQKLHLDFSTDDYDPSCDDIPASEDPMGLDSLSSTGGSAKIYPTLKSLRNANQIQKPIISASMLALKAKQFDDGLYAAVELSAQNGEGDFVGKISLLKTLLQKSDLP